MHLDVFILMKNRETPNHSHVSSTESEGFLPSFWYPEALIVHAERAFHSFWPNDSVDGFGESAMAIANRLLRT